VKTSGAYGEVDAFLTNDPINDDDPSLQYSTVAGGGWTDSNGRGFGDYRDDEHWTMTTGDSVLVPFIGSSAALITETEPTGADLVAQSCNATGGSCGTGTTIHTLTSTRLAKQLVFQSTVTTPSSQSLKITKGSGSYGQIDAIEVIP
jgi:alpha-galactosidase